MLPTRQVWLRHPSPLLQDVECVFESLKRSAQSMGSDGIMRDYVVESAWWGETFSVVFFGRYVWLTNISEYRQASIQAPARGSGWDPSTQGAGCPPPGDAPGGVLRAQQIGIKIIEKAFSIVFPFFGRTQRAMGFGLAHSLPSPNTPGADFKKKPDHSLTMSVECLTRDILVRFMSLDSGLLFSPSDDGAPRTSLASHGRIKPSQCLIDNTSRC